jgi:Ca-activated chloride channel homolog
MRHPVRRSFRSPLAALALLAGVSLGASGQVTPPAQESRTTGPPTDRPFRSHIEVISVNATVFDHSGKLVTDLPREAFEVYEDGEPRAVSQFTRERVPVSLGLLLDASDSMWGKRIVDARAAVEQFLFERLDQADDYFVMAFNHAPRVLTPWTNQPDVVRPALADLRPTGGTAVYDAVLAALPLLERRGKQRAAILIISDGADTASDATLREVRAALTRSDAFVYAVAIDPPADRPINTRVNTTALRELTEGTGGRTEVVRDTSELATATARIADELNNQYLIGYDSTRAPDGDFHSIRVRIKGTKYRVLARNGYIADPISRRLGLRPLPREQ